MSYPRTGRCLCGAVTVTLTAAPLAVAACHCAHCRRAGGAEFSLVGIVTADSITIDGELTAYHDHSRQGEPRQRRFCPTCGSPVETFAPANAERGVTIVKLSVFDDLDDFAPQIETFGERRAAWLPAFAEATVFDQMPPA